MFKINVVSDQGKKGSLLQKHGQILYHPLIFIFILFEVLEEAFGPGRPADPSWLVPA